MDPITIATSATALAAFAFRTSKAIYGGVDSIRNADATLLQLQNEVDALQSGLESIASTFQSSEVVQLFTSCLSVDGNHQMETIGTKLGQQLEDLAAQITDMQEKVSEANQDLRGDTLADDEADQDHHMKHIEEYIQTAEVLFSNASVYSGSVTGTVVGHPADVANLAGTFGSVLGMNDTQRRRVNNWIPGERIAEGSETDTATDEDDDEVDKDLFLARLKVAQKKLKAKEFKAAETQFEACLSETAVIKSLPQHEVVDLKLELATACRGAGNTKRQQSILNDLLELDLPKVQEFHLKHTLAVAYLDDFQLVKARSHADGAMKGRKKLLGRRHESYYESLDLLVTICKAQDDHDTADVYQDLLPPDFHQYTESEVPSLTAPSTDISAIKTLADNGYDINNSKTYFEALDWASKEKQIAIIRLLLERGTDIHARNKDDETMLFFACKNGIEDIATRLLDQGADIKTKSSYKRNILYYALEHEAIVKLLIDRGAEIENPESPQSAPLAAASSSNHIGAVKILLASGAQVEGHVGIYETPLQAASRAGHVEVVRLLIDAGAHINSMISYPKCTPLMCAALKGHVGVIRLLLERGADPKIKSGGTVKTALDLAKRYNHPEAVIVLKAARTGLFKGW